MSGGAIRWRDAASSARKRRSERLPPEPPHRAFARSARRTSTSRSRRRGLGLPSILESAPVLRRGAPGPRRPDRRRHHAPRHGSYELAPGGFCPDGASRRMCRTRTSTRARVRRGASDRALGALAIRVTLNTDTPDVDVSVSARSRPCEASARPGRDEWLPKSRSRPSRRRRATRISNEVGSRLCDLRARRAGRARARGEPVPR